MINGDLDYVKDPGDDNRVLYFDAVDNGAPITISIGDLRTARTPTRSSSTAPTTTRCWRTSSATRISASACPTPSTARKSSTSFTTVRANPLRSRRWKARRSTTSSLRPSTPNTMSIRRTQYLDKVIPDKDADGMRLRPDGQPLSHHLHGFQRPVLRHELGADRRTADRLLESGRRQRAAQFDGGRPVHRQQDAERSPSHHVHGRRRRRSDRDPRPALLHADGILRHVRQWLVLLARQGRRTAFRSSRRRRSRTSVQVYEDVSQQPTQEGQIEQMKKVLQTRCRQLLGDRHCAPGAGLPAL